MNEPRKEFPDLPTGIYVMGLQAIKTLDSKGQPLMNRGFKGFSKHAGCEVDEAPQAIFRFIFRCCKPGLTDCFAFLTPTACCGEKSKLYSILQQMSVTPLLGKLRWEEAASIMELLVTKFFLVKVVSKPGRIEGKVFTDILSISVCPDEMKPQGFESSHDYFKSLGGPSGVPVPNIAEDYFKQFRAYKPKAKQGAMPTHTPTPVTPVSGIPSGFEAMPDVVSKSGEADPWDLENYPHEYDITRCVADKQQAARELLKRASGYSTDNLALKWRTRDEVMQLTKYKVVTINTDSLPDDF